MRRSTGDGVPQPGFGDPFAGFMPMFGGGPRQGIMDPFSSGLGMGFGGGSLFGQVFGHDPFANDPFFSQPFGGLLGRPGLSFGGLPSPFGFQQPPAQQTPQENVRPIHVQIEDREPPRQRLVIEEVDGDDEEEEEEEAHSEQPEQSPRRTRARRERHEPVIEHPEDDDVPPPSPAGFSGRRAASDYNVYRETGDASRGWGHQQQQQQQLSSSGARVWSYSSSSVSYSGFGGQPYYSSSSTRRCGPNGVVEEQHQEHDAVEGRKTMSVLRGLGEKSRSVMRTKRAHGPEQSVETLRNITQEEAPRFDDTWRAHARTSLASQTGQGGANHLAPLHVTSNQGSRSNQQAALPAAAFGQPAATYAQAPPGYPQAPAQPGYTQQQGQQGQGARCSSYGGARYA